MNSTDIKSRENQSEAPSTVQKKEFDQKFITALGTGQLDIQAFKLTSVPQAAYDLKNLRRLLLQNNRLEVLSPQIGRLTSLVGLYLNDNLLIQIPSEMGQLRNLMTLALHNNRLTSLPKELGKCIKLQNLSLSCNKLTEVPLEIGDCSDLKTLEVRDNPDLISPPAPMIDQGPGAVADYLTRFGRARADRKLDLSKLKLRAFPIEVARAGSSFMLEELDLSDNALGSLPYAICALETLEVLRLVRCRLAGRLTQGLGELTDLTELRLDNNEIEALPIGLGRCTALTRLSIEHNAPLRLPPRAIAAQGHPHPARFLALLATSETTGRLGLPGLELVATDFLEVAVCSRRVAVVEEPLPPPGGPWGHITVLDLSQNRLPNLSESIGAMTSLVALLCHRNRLTRLPEAMTNLVALQHLRLDDNQFADFPAVICFADSGEQVEQAQTFGMDVSDLGVKATVRVWVHGRIRGGLESIDVSDNLLRTLHKAVVHLASLQVPPKPQNELKT